MQHPLRHCLIVLSLLAGLAPVRCQTYEVDTIQWNGNPARFINLVFLGDGYQEGQLGQYAQHVQNLSEYLFNITPFKEYRPFFNVFAVRVTSDESGATHLKTANDCPNEASHPIQTVNNRFGSRFDYFNIHRLLVPVNGSTINNVLFEHTPHFDQTLVLVNSPFYGGSGGVNATSSIHGSAFEILVHEIGHSFAGLADEYYAGDVYASERANMTKETNPDLVKWKHWLGEGGVGIYQHCCGGQSAQWYKPNQQCKMQSLGAQFPFCPVCRETLILRIQQLYGSPLLQAPHPGSELLLCRAGDTLRLGVQTVHPLPNTLRTRWYLDQDLIAEQTDTLILPGAMLSPGNYTLSLEILDTTAMVRAPQYAQQFTHTRSWTLRYDTMTPPVLAGSAPERFCAGDTLLLDAGPAAGWRWSDGSMARFLAVHEPGAYAVTVSNAYGCRVASDTVELAMDPVFRIEDPEQAICLGDSVYIYGAWQQQPGLLEDRHLSAAGCDSIHLTRLLVVPDTAVLVGEDFLEALASGAEYQWLDCAAAFAPIAGAESALFEPSQSGIYAVAVSQEGCTARSECFPVLLSAMEQPDMEQDWLIYPNPAGDWLMLACRDCTAQPWQLLDIRGRRVGEGTLAAPFTRIDLTTLPPGSYFLLAAGRRLGFIRQ
jgi:hypothetical protein